MKHLFFMIALFIGFLAKGQALQQYERLAKKTPAEIDAIDTIPRSDVVYTAIDSVNKKEKINWRDGNGWVDRFPSGAGTGDFLANGTVPMTGNMTSQSIFPSGDLTNDLGSNLLNYQRVFAQRHVWKGTGGFWVSQPTTAADKLGFAFVTDPYTTYSAQYTLDDGGIPIQGTDLITLDYFNSNTGTSSTLSQVLGRGSDGGNIDQTNLGSLALAAGKDITGFDDLIPGGPGITILGDDGFELSRVVTNRVMFNSSTDYWGLAPASYGGDTNALGWFRATSSALGGTFLYSLNSSGTPSSATDLTPKSYVDGVIGAGGLPPFLSSHGTANKLNIWDNYNTNLMVLDFSDAENTLATFDTALYLDSGINAFVLKHSTANLIDMRATFTAFTQPITLPAQTFSASGNDTRGASYQFVREAISTRVEIHPQSGVSNPRLFVGTDAEIALATINTATDVVLSTTAGPAKTGTGSALNLSNYYQYNFGAASAAATFTMTDIRDGGYAESLVNRTGEPTVTGATKRPNTAAWQDATNMILHVKDYDGTQKFWFTEFALWWVLLFAFKRKTK